ncbi:MAG: beta-xylosidase, partial [Verrucomicrobia bacterium]|nr:beta-xylosidase [Verrucomicrobiota bacterium]
MTIYYNAFHSPNGAHSSFTLGCLGKNGGLGLELGRPADENVYIGVESRSGGTFNTLPFYEGAVDDSLRYDHSRKSKSNKANTGALIPFALKRIRRDYQLGSDSWKADDLTFTIYSPVESAPEPGKAKVAVLKAAYRPSVLAELTIDNRKGKNARKAFFGYTPGNSTDAVIRHDDGRGMLGIGKGQGTAIFSTEPGMVAATGFTPEIPLKEVIPENYNFGLGANALLMVEVLAGQKKTYRFAVCFYRGGTATTGIETTYLYRRYYKNIADVGRYSLDHFAEIKKRALNSNRMIAESRLNPHQAFQMIHAIRSYYGSTQLLDDGKHPIWIVNEGEYRMMNTFDLTVDQLFYEIKMNPWTVRNELDLFTARYAYMDKTHFPGGENIHPGGISFTHDMGQHNHFSRPGYSAYELFNRDGCFSHMTHEQLVNWVLCAAVYAKKSKDRTWLKTNLPTLKKCLQSMLNRDHPRDSERNGLMALDSSRTMQGAEITTYDSLDASLGQSRNNVYMAVKCWAAYIAMEEIFAGAGLDKASAASRRQAQRASATIASFIDKRGFIPAVMGEPCDSCIIPAIEGLVF